MTHPTFTLAETNLMVIYNPGTRLGLTLSTLRKLERMTDTAFAALDLEIDGL